MYSRRAFALEFEHDETRIVTGAKKIELWVGYNDPKAVVFAAKCLHTRFLRHIPDPRENKTK
jgi:hypothetical protein